MLIIIESINILLVKLAKISFLNCEISYYI